MSAVASWSYTARATVWPLLGRDDWTGVVSFGPPESFDCDYSAESKRMTDALGVEFTSKQIIFTERADIKQGDMVVIGESVASTPQAAGAYEVKLIKRDADTFQREADDFQIVT